MKLITELNEDVSYVTEEVNGKRHLYLEGIYLQAGIKNKNGRIYPPHIMENEVNRYIKEAVDQKVGWGELNHPTGPEINPERIAIRICELNRNNNNWHGKSIVADTPMGNIVRGLMETGGKVGVSSRGLGSLKLNSQGINEVQNDFRLATAADVVINPSAPEAWVNGIMESVDWFYDERQGWKSLEAIDKTKNYVHENYKKLDEKAFIRLFETYLKTL